MIPGGWHPPIASHRGDLALLELTGPPPAGVGPAPVRAPATSAGHRFRACGFPRGHDDGVWAAGLIEGPAMGEWLQLVTDGGGYLIDKGFSGTPLWDESLSAVTGIVVSRETDPAVRAGFAVGAEVIGRYLPMLDPWLRWRVSDDPEFADYWDPRARGVERGSRPGVYFTGRYRAREQLTGWITDPDRENGLYVVTGGPGSGKSALIAWLLALGDPGSGTVWPARSSGRRPGGNRSRRSRCRRPGHSAGRLGQRRGARQRAAAGRDHRPARGRPGCPGPNAWRAGQRPGRPPRRGACGGRG